MEIQALRLVVAEDEANALLRKHLPPDLDVRDLRIGLTPAGVQIKGKYSGMLVPLSFEMLWEVAVADGLIQAKLAQLTVAGFAAGKLRGVLLGVLADHIAGQPGVTFVQETVHIDINAGLRAHDVPMQITPRAVMLSQGMLVFEAGQ